MTQLIKKPTRTTKEFESLIDIIAYSNNKSSIHATVFPMSIGDHDMIGCVRKITALTVFDTIVKRYFDKHAPVTVKRVREIKSMPVVNK